jgi:hypothetical protein
MKKEVGRDAHDSLLVANRHKAQRGFRPTASKSANASNIFYFKTMVDLAFSVEHRYQRFRKHCGGIYGGVMHRDKCCPGNNPP